MSMFAETSGELHDDTSSAEIFKLPFAKLPDAVNETLDAMPSAAKKRLRREMGLDGASSADSKGGSGFASPSLPASVLKEREQL